MFVVWAVVDVFSVAVVVSHGVGVDVGVDFGVCVGDGVIVGVVDVFVVTDGVVDGVGLVLVLFVLRCHFGGLWLIYSVFYFCFRDAGVCLQKNWIVGVFFNSPHCAIQCDCVQ